MEDNTYVLAMYDIRSKQDFIYRSSSMKEIMGGSLIIRDCFKDYLYPNADKVGRDKKGKIGKGIFHCNVPFTEKSFEDHLREGYIGELVYDGGGNFFVIYEDIEVYRDVNYEFSKQLLEEIGTLQILPVCIKVHFTDYKADQKKLYEKHRKEEGRQGFISPCGTLPFVQVDYSTSEPLVDSIVEYGEKVKITQESLAKRNKYRKALKGGEKVLDEKILDNMVQERGEESLLAVIYADGNNMGFKVKKHIENYKSYEECVGALRDFSQAIQRDYIDYRKKDIDEYLIEKYGEKGRRRFVIESGDEITFICNARYAYEIMTRYMEGLPADKSSCAGAAIFRSHAPYSDAYRIAEECCESGKKFMKDNGIDDNACYIDFHYCHGAIGVSLDTIRKEESDGLNSRPWLVLEKPKTDAKAVELAKEGPNASTEDVERCKEYLNRFGRSNVKELMVAARKNTVSFTLELKRIRAHMMEEARKEIDWKFLNMHRALVHDIAAFFDLWFADSSEQGESKPVEEVSAK